MTMKVGDRSLLTSRVFACSRARLFAAFTNASELARWWGPKGFTNTFHTFEPKSGGRWVFTMHGPTAGNYENESLFREVMAETRIVLEHVSHPRYVATFDFADEGTGARLTWRMDFETVERFEQVRKVAVGANEENLDRLEAVLASQT